MKITRTKRVAVSAAAALSAVAGVSGLTAAANADGLSPVTARLTMMPDLTVNDKHLDSQGHLHVSVTNRGLLAATKFRVAVLASAQSFSFHVSGLNPGASVDVNLSTLSCGQPAVVWADADHSVSEGDEANNMLAVNGSVDGTCLIDHGINGVGVHE